MTRLAHFGHRERAVELFEDDVRLELVELVARVVFLVEVDERVLVRPHLLRGLLVVGEVGPGAVSRVVLRADPERVQEELRLVLVRLGGDGPQLLHLEVGERGLGAEKQYKGGIASVWSRSTRWDPCWACWARWHDPSMGAWAPLAADYGIDFEDTYHDAGLLWCRQGLLKG